MKKLILVILFFTSYVCAMNNYPLVETFCFAAQGNQQTFDETFQYKEFVCNRNTYPCYGIFRGVGQKDIAEEISNQFFTCFQKSLEKNGIVQVSLEKTYRFLTELFVRKTVEISMMVSCLDEKTGVLTTLLKGNSRLLSTDQFCNSVIVEEDGCLVSPCLGNVISKQRQMLEMILKPRIETWSPYQKLQNGAEKYYGFSIAGTIGFWNAMQRMDEDELCGCLWDANNLSHDDFYKEYPPYYSGDDNLMVFDEDKDKGYKVNLAQRLCYIAVTHLNSSENVTVVVQLFGQDPWLFAYETSSSQESNSSLHLEEQD